MTWTVIRLILLIVLAAVLIPTIRMMREVEALERGAAGKNTREELKQKRAKLKTMQRVLIILFLIVLGATMLKIYIPILLR